MARKLGKLFGVGDKERPVTVRDEENARLLKYAEEMFDNLRSELDTGMRAFLQTGSSSALEDIAKPELVRRLISPAQPYRSGGLVWTFPGRMKEGVGSGSRQVTRMQRDKTGKQLAVFEVVENFRDRSRLIGRNNEVVDQADGQQLTVKYRIRVNPAAGLGTIEKITTPDKSAR